MDSIYKYTTKGSINGFFGPYRFLSNFHLVPIEYDGIVFPSTEHAYQAAKSLDHGTRAYIASLPTPREAKKAGMALALRPGWDKTRVSVMYILNHYKYMHNADLAQKLMDTNPQYLEETNTWHDTFWGVCEGIGQNNLGKILMDIRECLMLR